MQANPTKNVRFQSLEKHSSMQQYNNSYLNKIILPQKLLIGCRKRAQARIIGPQLTLVSNTHRPWYYFSTTTINHVVTVNSYSAGTCRTEISLLHCMQT
jgi:hypothetical protein